MSETIKLCAMLARAVFENDDEAREPFVEQAMRAKREHDEMRRELAEARADVTLLTEQRACDFRVMEGAQSLIAELTQERDASDTTRREWEVRAATSYAAGRAAGLREAAEVCHAIKQENGDDPRVWLVDYMEECEQRILAIAPPAAETVKAPRCEHCGKRDHAPPDCPNRTICKHGTLVDVPDNGNPPCWQCEVEPYRDEANKPAEPRDEGEVSDE